MESNSQTFDDIRTPDNLAGEGVHALDILSSEELIDNDTAIYSDIPEVTTPKVTVLLPAYRAMWPEVSVSIILIIALFILIDPAIEILESAFKAMNIEFPKWIYKFIWNNSMYASLFMAWVTVCRLWYFKNSNELTITDDFVMLKKGVFATKTVQIKMTHITSVETSQSIVDKILGVGALEIGSSSTSEMEIIVKGIVNPSRVAANIKSKY